MAQTIDITDMTDAELDALLGITPEPLATFRLHSGRLAVAWEAGPNTGEPKRYMSRKQAERAAQLLHEKGHRAEAIGPTALSRTWYVALA